MPNAQFCSNELINNISSDLIYNRFDLWNPKVNYRVIELTDRGSHRYIAVKSDEDIYQISDWGGQQFTREDISVIVDFLKDNGAKKIMFEGISYIKGDLPGKDVVDYRVMLPPTPEQIDDLINAKERSTNRRKTKLLTAALGDVRLIDHCCENTLSDEVQRVVTWYFTRKKEQYGIEYFLTPEEYIGCYHVSDAYELIAGTTTVGVLFSCEQGGNVFLENLSFDEQFAKLSPGTLMYNLYLKELCKKGKRVLFSGTGLFAYKLKYGGQPYHTRAFTVYLSNTLKWRELSVNYIKRLFLRVAPKSIIDKLYHIKKKL